ncbi:MAG: GNAT family N-acetyltransferase [Chitinophagaceae bacterium]|nr:GNAT family N-acetyltransferase [Chitinophagaceae bacterium]
MLRALEITDAQAVFLLRSDPAVLRYLGREPATDIKEAEDFIRTIQDNTLSGKSILWAIALKENPSALIGTICFWNIKEDISEAESGYALLPAEWGKDSRLKACKPSWIGDLTQQALTASSPYWIPPTCHLRWY